MNERDDRSSLLGPAMISVSILVLAGAIVYAGRPRVFEHKTNQLLMDDGTFWNRVLDPENGMRPTWMLTDDGP